MNCPKCNSETHTVVDVRDPSPSITTRRHWCGKATCGARWNSTTRIDKEPRVTFHLRDHDVLAKTQPIVRVPTQQVVSQPTQQVVPGKHNGLCEPTQPAVSSGSLSDLDPISSPSYSSPDPDLFPKGDQGVDREKKPRAPFVYPDAFEAFWGAISSPRNKGLKSDAHKAWVKRGKPGAAVLIAKWNEYLAALGDTFPKDVCRWVDKRGWEEEYEPARGNVRANGDIRLGHARAVVKPRTTGDVPL